MSRPKSVPLAKLTCCKCGRKIDYKETHWPEILAFARPKELRQGAGSSLVLRKTTGKVACNGCITEGVHGINRRQEVLR